MTTHPFFYVYILQSETRPKRFYTGYTMDQDGLRPLAL